MWDVTVNAYFDGFSARRVLVDTRVIENILLASIMKKLKKISDDLIPTETTVNGFVGDTTPSHPTPSQSKRKGQDDILLLGGNKVSI
ncbi:unnamed protein product [Prunus armeniaca]